ncbi:MAG: response regulator [Spartobacteria bacterium]|nr:response regulator [Spartobacteria bacterium]
MADTDTVMTQKLQGSQKAEIASGFATLIEMYSVQLYAHCRRVARSARAIGEELDLPDEQIEDLEIAAFLHDVGLVGVPEDSLIGAGAEVMGMRRARQHPVTGYTILCNIEGYEDIAQAVLHHHERYDGSGFPHRLWGKNIPYYSRIIAVADTYDLHLHNGIAQRSSEFTEARNAIARDRDAGLERELVDIYMAILTKLDNATSTTDDNELELVPGALMPGMVLSRDLRSVNNLLLLKAGTVLTEVLINRVLNSDKAGQMVTVAYVDASTIHEEQLPLPRKGVGLSTLTVASRRSAESPEEKQLGGVLVVDDSRAVAHALRRELSRAGMEVVGITSGHEALDLLSREQFDTVIVDLVLGDMNGVDLLRAIQRKLPNMYCVVLSGHATSENIKALRELNNVVRFVRKPWTQDVLLSAVREAIDRSRRVAV